MPNSTLNPIPTPAIVVSDETFVQWFDLGRPSMAEAAARLAAGDTHGAALAAAVAAGEGHAGGAVVGGQLRAPTRAAILRHFPNSLERELKIAELLLKDQIPGEAELGFIGDKVLGIRARSARKRGHETLLFALLYATTGEPHWAVHAIRAGLRAAAEILPLADSDTPAAYAWHPHAPKDLQSHDMAHRLQYWLQAWPLLEDALSAEERLAWMKVIIAATRDRLRANRHEIPFNMTLHPLVPTLQVAAAFPALKEAPEWHAFMLDKLERDYCQLPVATADGYTREDGMYHQVNTRLLTIAYLTLLRSHVQSHALLRQTLDGAYAIIALQLCPDGSYYMLGDSHPLSFHEHWQDAHEALHLGAALLNRPDWKQQAGSLAGTQPELLNLWLMGTEGIERWVSWPQIDVGHRVFPNAHAPHSVFHALRAGKGINGHAGLLSFGSELNHAHHDTGQVLLYGLGRHLLSDTGHPGYGGRTDMVDGYSTRVHAVVNVIRRVPLGPRTDYTDYVKSLGTFESDTISLSSGEHTLYENHVVQRALALVSPHGRENNDGVFWIILDRVTWKRGWPVGSNEPYELIDTVFPFHAPGCPAQVSADGRSVWSLYDGPSPAPYVANGPSRRDLSQAYELSDSDANLQITRLDTSGCQATWDIELREGWSNAQGGEIVPRPMGVYRWRGLLPHVSAYILVPYRGLRDDAYAEVRGTTSADGCRVTVTLGGKTWAAAVTGFETGRLQGKAGLP